MPLSPVRIITWPLPFTCILTDHNDPGTPLLVTWGAREPYGDGGGVGKSKVEGGRGGSGGDNVWILVDGKGWRAGYGGLGGMVAGHPTHHPCLFGDRKC